jgi:uncharacterized protein YjeT (DUF2065 family)
VDVHLRDGIQYLDFGAKCRRILMKSSTQAPPALRMVGMIGIGAGVNNLRRAKW